MHRGPLPAILNLALSEKKRTGEYLIYSYVWSLALVHIIKIWLNNFQENFTEVFFLGFFHFSKAERCQRALVISYHSIVFPSRIIIHQPALAVPYQVGRWSCGEENLGHEKESCRGNIQTSGVPLQGNRIKL